MTAATKNLKLARQTIARMRRNGHRMTAREAEQHAQRIASLLDATDLAERHDGPGWVIRTKEGTPAFRQAK